MDAYVETCLEGYVVGNVTTNCLQIAETAVRHGKLKAARALCHHIRDALEATAEPGRNFSIFYAQTLKLQAAAGEVDDAREALAKAVEATRELSLAVSLPLLGGLAVVETIAGNFAEARSLFVKAFAETENLEYDRILFSFSNEQVEGLGVRQTSSSLDSPAAAMATTWSRPPHPCDGRLRIHYQPPAWHNAGSWRLDAFRFAGGSGRHPYRCLIYSSHERGSSDASTNHRA